MIKLSILGCGYSGQAIARHCMASDSTADIIGTRRDSAGLDELKRQDIPGLVLSGTPTPEVIRRLEHTTHLISSVAPARSEPLDDPMLPLVQSLALSGRLPRLRWIAYLSTIGVYGDHGGAVVDESTPCTSQQMRSVMRAEAESGWQSLGAESGVPVCILRLSGIYGPGRNALEDVLAGRARRVHKPGHVFNRIHVEDIAAFAASAMTSQVAGIFNVTDDKPAASAEVVAYACELLKRPVPELVDFDSASMSPMALSFWAESKRVDNARGKTELGFRYRYPSFREGLAAEHRKLKQSVEAGQRG
jgi:nucleoside-diphosphate-sugar epimerase